MYGDQLTKTDPGDRQPTFMESTVKRTISTSESISIANQKLIGILNKLRGSRPADPDTNETNKKEVSSSHCDQLDARLTAQVGMLNFLQNQIDELMTII